jgi:hypothetical protein
MRAINIKLLISFVKKNPPELSMLSKKQRPGEHVGATIAVGSGMSSRFCNKIFLIFCICYTIFQRIVNNSCSVMLCFSFFSIRSMSSSFLFSISLAAWSYSRQASSLLPFNHRLHIWHSNYHDLHKNGTMNREIRWTTLQKGCQILAGGSEDRVKHHD